MFKVSFLSFLAIANAFQPVPLHNVCLSLKSSSSNDDEPLGSSSSSSGSNRRSFLVSSAAAAFALPQLASAGIDVGGLRVDGGGVGNPSLVNQLKAYDGSGSARVREIQSTSQGSVSGPRPSIIKTLEEDDRIPVATWAYKYNPGVGPSLSKAGAFGNLYRLQDTLVAPSDSKRRSIGVSFEFPSDWLQLDKYIGGIQYVDQRNGDKLYVLRAPLPADTSLAMVSKSTIGDLIFVPNGSFAKSGQTVEDYKVASAQILNECPNNMCATRRRFKVKFATLTGNGLRVERRALIDAYQVDSDIYMLMTSSNAVKFEQKDSRERETVENIVSSFQIDV